MKRTISPDTLGSLGSTLGTILSDDGTILDWFKESESAIEIALSGIEGTVTEIELASPTGGNLVGFHQDGPGSVERNLLSKTREIISPFDKGAIGDGVTIDNTAFALAEQMDAAEINLAGKSYALTPFALDTVNGIQLRKDYVNGTLIVGGVPIVFNNKEGMARSAASEPMLIVPKTTKNLGLNRADENNYYVWRPLGGRYWARYLLTRASAGLPFNLSELYIQQKLAFKTAEESGVTYSGTNTQLNSGSATLYINGRARRLEAADAYVEVEFQGGGDIFIAFYAREDGNFVNVTLDGGQSYLVLPDDGSGNKYFDSYANPVVAKKIVQVASGVPEGTHTIRLTVSASKNPAQTSGNNRFWFNAVGWDSASVGPWSPQTTSNPWVSGEDVLQNEERFSNGRWYIAAAAGTTGSTAPSHSTGSVSDGGVSWTYRTSDAQFNSYGLPGHRIQGPGSQLEYAYQIKPAGATTKEDVGGAAHGNEAQTSFRWMVNNSEVTIVDSSSWAVGEMIEIQEKITATHSEIGGSATPVVLTTLRRQFNREYVTISHTHVPQVSGEWGWMYAHMWPLLHYNAGSAGYKTAITEMWSPCGTHRKCSDYYYDPLSPAYQDDSVEVTKDYLMIARGDALVPDGTLEAMGKGDTGLKFHAWLQVSPESVNNYASKNRTFASKSMNMSNKNPLTDPASSMICKMYFMRYDGVDPTFIPAGTVIECRARYGFALTTS